MPYEHYHRLKNTCVVYNTFTFRAAVSMYTRMHTYMLARSMDGGWYQCQVDGQRVHPRAGPGPGCGEGERHRASKPKSARALYLFFTRRQKKCVFIML